MVRERATSTRCSPRPTAPSTTPSACAIYREVARKLIDDAPSIWAAYPKLIEVMRDDVQDYMYSPLNYTGVFSFYPIWLQK